MKKISFCNPHLKNLALNKKPLFKLRMRILTTFDP